MYNFFLFLHSWTRWILVLLLLGVFSYGLYGWLLQKAYSKKYRILGMVLVGFAHLQLLTGIILYFWLSPISRTAWQNLPYSLHNKVLRYWGMEHLVGMLVMVIIIQIAQIYGRKAKIDAKKYKRTALLTGFALIILITILPWPQRKDIGRPLFLTDAAVHRIL